MSAAKGWLSKRWSGRVTFPSLVVLTFLLAVGWFTRASLRRFWLDHPAALPAVFGSLVVWISAVTSILILEKWGRRRRWLRRTTAWTGLRHLRRPSAPGRWLNKAPDPLEAVFHPVLHSRWGRMLASDWMEAGLGTKASRYCLMLVSTAVASAWFGNRIGGLILATGLAVAMPVLPIRWVQARAEERERQFREQIPSALESISAGLAAGLSFHRAVDYAVEEQPRPIRDALGRLERRLRLGAPVEEAASRLVREHPEESLILAVEGIILQQKLGGDLVQMLEQSAVLARTRVELEREVHAVTAQGRFSGWVIAGLVPASAGILLATNPQYVDVLFETVAGQVLLVAAITLQLVGWAVISRLIRVQY